MKNWTYIFIGLMILLITAYDIFAILTSGTESSISSIMIIWAYKYPAFPFLVGFVSGHLFWRMKNNKDTEKEGI